MFLFFRRYVVLCVFSSIQPPTSWYMHYVYVYVYVYVYIYIDIQDISSFDHPLTASQSNDYPD